MAFNYSVQEIISLIIEMSADQATDICNDDMIGFVMRCDGTGVKNLDSMKFTRSVESLSDTDKNTVQQAVWGGTTKIGWLMNPIT